MRRIYTVIFYLLIPAIMIRLFIKGRKQPAYRERILERFMLAKQPQPVDIWLHAVSLGEAIAATPLIERLLGSNHRLMITTMTPTGSQHIQNQFKNRVQHQYIPYDLPWCAKRFLRAINAKMAIMLETELWPNLICEAHRSSMKVVLVNARISDKAFHQYRRVALFFSPILKKFAMIGTQSELDAARYRALGAPKEKVYVFGNIKFDLCLSSAKIPPTLFDFKRDWGMSRPVLIAASTHDDEERQLLRSWERLRETIPDLLLLIAPRRPERFESVYQLCHQMGFKTARRSQPHTINASVDVILLDSLGELLFFYQLSDFAFVGGSLVSIGGHNVLEPIAVHVPVFTGPFMQNSKTICQALQQAEAIQWCKNIDDLVNNLLDMFKNPHKRQQQIANASQVLKSNQGSVAQYIAKIEEILFAKK